MKNIVLKAILVGVAAIAAAGILVFSLWILISPQSMATTSEKLGNYNFAVTCANLKYKYSDKTEDLARCAEDSILSGKDKLIVKYCEKLIAADDFNALCNQRNEELKKTQFGQHAANYKTYILGNLALSQYRTGDLRKAVKTAEQGEVGCFNKLVLEIILNGTAKDKEDILKYPEKSESLEHIQSIMNAK